MKKKRTTESSVLSVIYGFNIVFYKTKGCPNHLSIGGMSSTSVCVRYAGGTARGGLCREDLLCSAIRQQ